MVELRPTNDADVRTGPIFESTVMSMVLGMKWQKKKK